MIEIAFQALAAAREHALRDYPRESCGLVVDGVYVPCFNYATLPEQDFIIASAVMKHQHSVGTVQAVVHSHPNGPLFPSERDMQGQVDTALPWVIIPVSAERTGDPIIWDADAPPAPLIGRPFVHGVSDCYTLIRDAYRLGAEGMAAQEMPGWPMPPVELPEQPRRDGWWKAEDNAPAQDLYTENFLRAGFRKITAKESRPGDVFLVKIASDVPNHGGVRLENGLILHHLPTRASRREPLGVWGRAIETWLRHEAADQAHEAAELAAEQALALKETEDA